MKLLKKVIIAVVLCLFVSAGLFAEVKASAATIKKDGKYHIEYYDENKLGLSLTSTTVTFKNLGGIYRSSDLSNLGYKTCKFKVNKNTQFVYEDIYKNSKKNVSRTKVRKMFKNKFSDFFGESWGWGVLAIDVTVKNGVAEKIEMCPFYPA